MPEDDEQTIVIAYYLHNLYMAFEQICVLVSQAIENQILDRSQWHALLLQRMARDIDGVRPRLFSDESFSYLDELRGFRHVFRSAYKISLDPERIALVLKRAQKLKESYSTDLAKFKAFLDTL